jgi:hypothetical protein
MKQGIISHIAEEHIEVTRLLRAKELNLKLHGAH